MRAVAYCRVSTDSEEQLNSLQNQINHYSNLFKKEGYSSPKIGMFFKKEGRNETKHLLDNAIFADEGISGTKLKNRKAFEYMMECAERKEFDVIYVKNVARWSRFTVDGGQALKNLKALAIRVIFEDGNLDSWDDEVVINIFLSLSQEESRSKSAAVQWGIRKAQEAGKWNSQPPYGYDIVDGYLQKNEAELETVKKIFDWFLNGWGTGKITRELNNQGIYTKNGKLWSQTQVTKILDYELYTGKQITHRVYNDDINNERKKAQKRVDPKDWIITYREELRIIDDETFLRIKLLREQRRKLNYRGQKNSDKHLLSNLLYCGDCGGNMKRKKRHTYIKEDGKRVKKYNGYEQTCQIHDMYGSAKCGYRNAIPEEVLIDYIKMRIRIIQTEKEILDSHYRNYMSKNFDIDNSEDRLVSIEESINKLNKQVKLNFDLLSEGVIGKEEYKQRNDILQNQLSDLQGEKDRIIHLEQNRKLAEIKFKEYCQNLKQIDVEKLTNATLKKIFDKITIMTNESYVEKKISKEWLEHFKMTREETLEDLNKQALTLKIPNGNKKYHVKIKLKFLEEFFLN